MLAYWLSNTSTLLFLLQRTLKASGAAGGAPKGRRPNVTLFGRMTQVSCAEFCYHSGLHDSFKYLSTFVPENSHNSMMLSVCFSCRVSGHLHLELGVFHMGMVELVA